MAAVAIPYSGDPAVPVSKPSRTPLENQARFQMPALVENIFLQIINRQPVKVEHKTEV